jgi:hypothetical protein
VKAKPELKAILKKIAAIQRMERGKLCPMRAGAYHNHQTWEKGRNLVRYVPRKSVADLQKAIEGYQQYLTLTQTYADQVIRRTRQTRPPKTTPTANKRTKKHKPPRNQWI